MKIYNESSPFFKFCINQPCSHLGQKKKKRSKDWFRSWWAFLSKGLHSDFFVLWRQYVKHSGRFEAILWWQLCIWVDSWVYYPFPFFIKGCVSPRYINLEITVIHSGNKVRENSFHCTPGFIYVIRFLHLLLLWVQTGGFFFFFYFVMYPKLFL